MPGPRLASVNDSYSNPGQQKKNANASVIPILYLQSPAIRILCFGGVLPYRNSVSGLQWLNHIRTPIFSPCAAPPFSHPAPLLSAPPPRPHSFRPWHCAHSPQVQRVIDLPDAWPRTRPEVRSQHSDLGVFRGVSSSRWGEEPPMAASQTGKYGIETNRPTWMQT